MNACSPIGMELADRLRKVNTVWWFVLGFAIFSLAYEVGRVVHLRPQPHHLWRQTDCISLAWNYYDTTWNLFQPAVHNQFADDHSTGKSAGEFPLLYWIVGMLWRLTGPSEPLYRLLVLLLHFAGTLTLFLSGRRIVGSSFWAWCTALLFYASPVLVYFGISFLTDVPAFDLALIGWWYVVRYADHRRPVLWRWAVFFFSLAMLLKITAGMSLLALGFILLLKTMLRARAAGSWSLFNGDVQEWAALLLGLFSVAAWYAYASIYDSIHGAKYTFNDLWPIWTMTAQKRAATWSIGRSIVVYQVFDTSVWILMGIAAAMLLLNARRLLWQPVVLLITLTVGTVLYLLCWFQALDNHDYYLINPMILPIVLLTTLLWWLGKYHPHTLHAQWSRWPMVALLAFNVAYTAQNMRMRYDTSGKLTPDDLWPIYHRAELDHWNGNGYWDMEDLVHITPHLRALGVQATDKVIFIDDGTINASLVLMGNRGWTAFGSGLWEPGGIDKLITRGARVLAFSRAEWLDDPRLAPYLAKPMGQVGHARFFRLTAPGLNDAAPSTNQP